MPFLKQSRSIPDQFFLRQIQQQPIVGHQEVRQFGALAKAA
jgi:hypothetical protein